MARIEDIEMDSYREQLILDVKKLVEKYRSIFGWNVPDNDQTFSDKLILAASSVALMPTPPRFIHRPQQWLDNCPG